MPVILKWTLVLNSISIFRSYIMNMTHSSLTTHFFIYKLHCYDLVTELILAIIYKGNFPNKIRQMFRRMTYSMPNIRERRVNGTLDNTNVSKHTSSIHRHSPVPTSVTGNIMTRTLKQCVRLSRMGSY